MNKRQAKIEAIKIAAALCLSCDMGMWDEDSNESIIEQDKILKELYKLGYSLDVRANKLKNSLTQV